MFCVMQALKMIHTKQNHFYSLSLHRSPLRRKDTQMDIKVRCMSLTIYRPSFLRMTKIIISILAVIGEVSVMKVIFA